MQQQETPSQPQVPPSAPDQIIGQPPSGSAPQPSASMAAGSGHSRRFPKWLKIAGIILLVFIVIMVFVVMTVTNATRAPQKVSDQFVNYVQSGDSNTAYSLTSSSFKQATSQTQFDQVINRVGPVLQGTEKVTGRTIEKATGIPQTAVLVYEVATSNGTKYIKTELQKSGDEWRVINFRSSDKPLEAKVE